MFYKKKRVRRVAVDNTTGAPEGSRKSRGKSLASPIGLDGSNATDRPITKKEEEEEEEEEEKKKKKKKKDVVVHSLCL